MTKKIYSSKTYTGRLSIRHLLPEIIDKLYCHDCVKAAIPIPAMVFNIYGEDK